MKNRCRIIGATLLAVYICFTASTHLFFHTHFFPWGRITHSHFYTNTHHEHTQDACDLLSYIALTSDSIELSDSFLLPIPLILVAIMATPVKKEVCFSIAKLHLLRAPPALSR